VPVRRSGRDQEHDGGGQPTCGPCGGHTDSSMTIHSEREFEYSPIGSDVLSPPAEGVGWHALSRTRRAWAGRTPFASCSGRATQDNFYLV
jgi:hypothetical protein